MQVPLQIVFEHVDHSDAIEASVRKEAQKLQRFYDRMTSARVVVGRAQHGHHKGDVYSVRIHIAVPGGKDIVINREPAATGRHEDIDVTIRDAFDSAGRQLQDVVRKRQGAVKAHSTPPHGKVASLVPDRDHGFIATSDGREIYFHRNSVIEGSFDKLEVGQDVRFSEAVGDKGPQATSVRPMGKHHLS